MDPMGILTPKPLLFRLCRGFYPPGNEHVPSQASSEDDFPFPKVGYVSSLEGTTLFYRVYVSIIHVNLVLTQTV